jgi:uncharacterized delta-60 repeat protein
VLASFGENLRAQLVNPVNDGFNPNPNGIVNAVAVQPDGKILMGGYFTQIQPDGNPVSTHNYIARLNHDGSVDSSFSPSTNGVVRSIVLQPSGQILISGEFTTVQGTGSSTAVTRNYVARLNADGTLDNSFNPNANAIVYAVAYENSGQVVIGGSFTSIQPTGSSSPVTRNHIARINADGSLDINFNPNTDKTVLSLAVQNNGQIIVGGGFSVLQPTGAALPITRNCIARLNPDGSLDTGFDPEASGSVMAIAIQTDGKIIVGGQFTSFEPNGATAATQCDFLARINTDGSLDNNFIVNPLAYVSALAIQGDGEILIGGIFTSVYAVNSTAAASISYAARINPDGSVDYSFDPGPDQAVQAIAVESDGDVILGGYFSSLQGETRNFIARTGTDGSMDSTLAPDAQGGVITSANLSNGQRLVGGTFTSMGGVSQSFLARINADGTLDSTFTPTINGAVQAIAVQTDGKYLLGGSFTEIDGITRAYIARMNTDGSLDGPFNPNTNGSVSLINLQSNGQIIISGSFSVLTPNGATTGTGVGSLARVNTDGTIDTTFNPDPSGTVHAMLTQSDGKILIAGEFTSVAGTSRGYIARLNSDYTLDTSFDPEANLPIYAMALESNGQIIIGGDFTGLEPQTGKIGTPTTVVEQYQTITVPQAGTSATTPIYINHLARLNADGTLDTTFFPDPSATVYSIVLETDGSMFVGGRFTSFAQNGNPTGTLCNYVGHVKTDGSLDTSFNPSPNNEVDLIQSQSNGEFLIGGIFTALQPNGASAPIPATHMALIKADGSLDTSFTGSASSAATGQVNAGVIQPDGQLLIGGSFSPFGGAPGSYLSEFNPNGGASGLNANVNGPVNAISVLPGGALTGVSSNYAVWLNSNGTVRYSYSAQTNGEVSVVVQQPDGKILIGGAFSGFAGSTGTGYLVRLNIDGTVDTAFNPSLNGQVSAIALQSNGQIVIGGSFINILAGYQVSYLARLNADGTLDTTFMPAPNLSVNTLNIQSDGKIIVGGNFTAMETSQTTTDTARNYIARLNTDGTLDTTFNPDLNGPPSAVIILSNGQVLVGGDFSTVDPNYSSTVSSYASLIRLNSDGTLDTTFDPSPNGPVYALALEPNGQILAGGSFSTMQPNLATASTAPTILNTGTFVRINTNGTIDTTFQPNPNGVVDTIVVLPNQQLLVGGGFTSFQPGTSSYATNRLFLSRLNSDGTVDPSFDPELNSAAAAILLLQDGSLLIGGSFTGINVGGALLIGGSFTVIGGNPAPYLARLNADTTVDASFTSNADGVVNALTPQIDGKTLVGGAFAHIGSSGAANVGRINTDGSVDSSFSASTNGVVNAIAMQPNGQIVIGGSFSTADGQTANSLARLASSGALDTTFTASINGAVNAVALQQNGQIVVGGSFTTVDGTAVGGVARLNSDGTIDSTFTPSANGTVYTVSVETDGSVLIGGSFTTVGGQKSPYAARLFSSGAVDTTFNPQPNAPVHLIMVQSDGKIVIGGAFTSVGGLSRYEFARVATPTPVLQNLTASSDESTIIWSRSGGAPTFSSVLFEQSTDGTHWVSAGQGTPVDANTWEITGLQPAGAVSFLIRATGVVPSSQNSSSGLLQSIHAVNILTIPLINSVSQVTAYSGTPFSFTVTASQTPTFFSASGLPPGLTINANSGVISGTPTGAGTYTVALTAENASGFTTSTLVITTTAGGATSYTPAATSAAGRILNISCRTQLAGTDTLAAGFVVTGTGQKTVLIRAVGPGLSSFNVSGTLATPELQLYSNSGTVIAQNTGWGGSSTLASTFTQVGAFPLPANSADAAIVTSLAPGAYTIHVFDASGKGGVVLTEIYDASATPLTDTARLTNISAQGTVSSGSGALIGGFVISGSAIKSVLIRGVGPGLSGFGVSGWLTDPVLSVFDSNGNLVAQNLMWSKQVVSGPYQATVNSANIINLDALVGAFALSTGDTAVVTDLPPGAYTFEVTSASNSQGRALGEVYELP